MAPNHPVVRARRRAAHVALHLIPAEHRSAARADVAELGFAVFGFLLYFLVRGAVVSREADALSHAYQIIAFESALGIFVEPEVQRWVLSSEWLWRTFNFVYFWFDFPLIVAVGLVLFWRKRTEYMLLRDSLLTSGVLALLVYFTYPVAPPRFLPQYGFVDTLAVFSNLSYQAQSMRPFVNPYAAVPSLHVGWALLLVVSTFRATPRWEWRAAVAAIFALQLVAVVGTGNHFILDGVVGLAVCLAALWLTYRLHGAGYPLLRRRLGGWARHPEALGDRRAVSGRAR